MVSATSWIEPDWPRLGANVTHEYANVPHPALRSKKVWREPGGERDPPLQASRLQQGWTI